MPFLVLFVLYFRLIMIYSDSIGISLNFPCWKRRKFLNFSAIYKLTCVTFFTVQNETALIWVPQRICLHIFWLYRESGKIHFFVFAEHTFIRGFRCTAEGVTSFFLREWILGVQVRISERKKNGQNIRSPFMARTEYPKPIYGYDKISEVLIWLRQNIRRDSH